MPDLSKRLGWLLIGSLFGTFFFGFNTYQVLTYFRSYHRDPWQQKTFVFFIWLLELAHGVLSGYLAYTVFVTNFTDLNSALNEAYLKLSLTGFISVTITALVQWYFAYRLYKLSNSKLIPLISATFSLMRWICYIGAGIFRQMYHSQTQDWKWGLFAVGILSIISDILMAVKLSVCLWRRRKEGKPCKQLPFGYPFEAVDAIIIVSIQANALTCIVTTITIILYNTCTEDFVWVAMTLIASRLFAISLLSSVIQGKKLIPRIGQEASEWLSKDSPMILQTEKSFGGTEPMISIEPSERSEASEASCSCPLQPSSRNSLALSSYQIRNGEESPV